MWFVELLVVLGFIFLGARLGSIGMGFAGGLGVLVLALVFGVEPGRIPVEVILIVMGVISTIAAMQVAGGLDCLVRIATKILQNNPKRITFLAPVVTYTLTLLAGTGAVSFSILPVVAEVAKRAGIRPSRPLSIAVVASLVGITASPISAAVIIFSGMLAGVGVDYIQLLLIAIPSTFLAVMAGAAVAGLQGRDLKDDPVYQDRLARGLVRPNAPLDDPLDAPPDDPLDAPLDDPLNTPRPGDPRGKRALSIFAVSIVCVVSYALASSSQVALIKEPTLNLQHAIISFMLAAAALITLLCRVDPHSILNASTFKSGMSACFCVLGVA
jgi:anaerobic C4-dicarboxylate transporter DcuA